MMRLRSAAALLAGLGPIAVQAQGRTIDEGTFLVTVAGGASQTENFKITHGDNGLITATGQSTGATQRITSSLTADATGTPVKYDLAVWEKGARVLNISVAAIGGRLTSMSSNQRGDEAMHEYPLTAGRSLILDDALVHELYFFPLAKRQGAIDVISPRDSRAGRSVLTAKGLEPITVAGQSLTATHYTLGDGAARREFWIDAAGRLLRVEIPAKQLVAVREEGPK